MKLFFMPGTCALAPHIVMAELNMVYELEAVSKGDKKCASGNYLDINPKGSVPALKMDNGEILTESQVISQYIADHHGEGKLLPKFGTLERIRTLEWMNFIATDMHKSYTPLFIAERVYKTPETQNEVKSFYKEVVNSKLKFVEEKLGKNDFLMGNSFTIADAYMFTVLSWSRYVGVDLSAFPSVTNYLKRLSERPSVIRAMKEEGLIK